MIGLSSNDKYTLPLFGLMKCCAKNKPFFIDGIPFKVVCVEGDNDGVTMAKLVYTKGCDSDGMQEGKAKTEVKFLDIHKI